MVLDSIDQSELYAAFLITDYYLDTHTSSLVPVIPKKPAENTFSLTYDDDHIELTDTVSANNGDVYVYFTFYNPNEQEVFVHLDQVSINGDPVDAELWIEGNGEYDGIPYQETSSDTLILSGMAEKDLSDIQTISMSITIVDAQTDEVIAADECTGYLSLKED